LLKQTAWNPVHTQLCEHPQQRQKLHATKALRQSTLKFVLQAAVAQELQVQVHKQLFGRWQDLGSVLNVSRKLLLFHMTAQEGLVEEEEEEFKTPFLSIKLWSVIASEN
jgi:hypothetical protein